MKRIFLMLFLVAVAVVAYASTPVFFLEMNEILVFPMNSDGGQKIKVEVASKEAAIALMAQLAPLFAGKTYESKLHYHYTDQPCILEPLPQ